jgi:hypothetical protein
MSQPVITLYDIQSTIPQPWAPNIWRIRYAPASHSTHREQYHDSRIQVCPQLQTPPIPHALDRGVRRRERPSSTERSPNLLSLRWSASLHSPRYLRPPQWKIYLKRQPHCRIPRVRVPCSTNLSRRISRSSVPLRSLHTRSLRETPSSYHGSHDSSPAP